jgi:hypothetical protein
MDYILAEFNRVCIYTVPKYPRPSDVSWLVTFYHFSAFIAPFVLTMLFVCFYLGIRQNKRILQDDRIS